MIDDEKGYKKVMDENYKIYCKQNSDDLKNASRNNPKHFWNILKRFDVDLMYSFIISSSPQALLFFKFNSEKYTH
jgi:hypothetical protein